MSAVDITSAESEAVAIVNETVAAARAIEVQTPQQAQQAVEFLSQIKNAKDRNEAARVFIVGPLNTQVKAINAKFKENVAPLQEVDAKVRAKLLAFQEREATELAGHEAAEAAARAERQAAAEAERQRAAEEEARIEHEARETEQRRQAELRNAQNERAREIAAMNDDELHALAIAGVVSDGSAEACDAELAEQELSSRRSAREAQERADAARREAEEATQASIAAASSPAVRVEATQLASASGSASARKRWTGTVVDETRVPREYLIIDQKKINAAVKEGVREIPGVSIEQTSELAVRTAR